MKINSQPKKIKFKLWKVAPQRERKLPLDLYMAIWIPTPLKRGNAKEFTKIFTININT